MVKGSFALSLRSVASVLRAGVRSGSGPTSTETCDLPRLQHVKAPDKGELGGLAQLISQPVGRAPEHEGLLEQEPEHPRRRVRS